MTQKAERKNKLLEEQVRDLQDIMHKVVMELHKFSTGLVDSKLDLDQVYDKMDWKETVLSK